jgi:hypothetical protein
MNLEFPKNGPLGASVSINRVHESKRGTFEFELQSGDILRIAATIGYFVKILNQ